MGKNVQPKAHAKITRTGKKRGKMMLAAEERKKTKLDWEDYYNNWHGGMKHNTENMKVAQDELDALSESEEEVLPIDMLDEDEYKLKGLNFLKNATLEAERKPRKFNGDDSENSEDDETMAVRDEQGNIVKSKVKREKKISKPVPKNFSEVKKEVDSDAEFMSDDEEADKNAPTSAMEIIQLRQQKLEKLKMKLATCAEKITSKPDDLSNLKMLRYMVRSISKKLLYTDPEIAVAGSRLQILTCCEIFMSILPDYRIIDRSEEPETKVKLSKEVELQYKIEAALLNVYQEYLTMLETEVLKKARLSKIRMELLKQIKPAACRALCKLFTNCSDFNFHNNITVVLVSLFDINFRSKFIITEVIEAFESMFKSDLRGEASKHAATAICQFIRDKKYKNIPVDLLKSFEAMTVTEVKLKSKADLKDEQVRGPLKEKKGKKFGFGKEKLGDIGKKQKERGKKHHTKSDKAKFKEQLKVDKTMQETSSTYSKEEKVKHHTVIIENIFSVYFVILKSGKEQPAKRRLFRTAISGLKKFSHLINIEFFSDLYKVFSVSLKDNSLSTLDRLLVSRTAATLLAGQGESLNIDPYNFQVFVYQQIKVLDQSEAHWEHIFALVEDLLIRKRRQINSRTVSYFVASIIQSCCDIVNAEYTGVDARSKNNKNGKNNKNNKNQKNGKNNQKNNKTEQKIEVVKPKAEYTGPSRLFLCVALLGLVRKLLVMFGTTASHLLDPSHLDRAIVVSREDLPVIAVPITVCIVKELNMLTSKCSNSHVNALIKSIRSVGKRAGQVAKVSITEDGEEVTQSNANETEIYGKDDALWATQQAELMVSIAKQMVVGEVGAIKAKRENSNRKGGN